ncbi:MAG: glycosyltransferase family 2 protein [Nanoarchaeota archaeon]|nr:glycosyltransferase family 2 protein [Nanoarchaeota archaeon]
MKISVVLPCRNEEGSIAICIEKIKKAFESIKEKDYEIIVSDSSRDKSAEIAKKIAQNSNKKVKVIKHDLDGYGNACLKGIEHAKGKYVIIGDVDNTYDFSEIPRFIEELDKGYDLVIGSRFKGKIERGAMPFSHRYIGTPILNFLLSLFFRKKISDCNSGFRAIKKEALDKLSLKTTGMEFASEMLIKAIKNNLKIKEIPITYSKRTGNSKLKSFSDGWKHLRFMLLYSPNYVFLIPGIFLTILGFILMLLILTKSLTLFGITFQTHPMFIGSVLVILGYQLILTGFFSRIYAHNHLGEKDYNLEKMYSFFNLEKAITAGAIFLLAGLYIFLNILIKWLSTNFGELATINLSIFALTFIILGIQTIFAGFFFSILGIKEK